MLLDETEEEDAVPGALVDDGPLVLDVLLLELSEDVVIVGEELTDVDCNGLGAEAVPKLDPKLSVVELEPDIVVEVVEDMLDD